MDKYHAPCPVCGQSMYRYSKSCFNCSGKNHRTPEERRIIANQKTQRFAKSNPDKRKQWNKEQYEKNKEKRKKIQREYNRIKSKEINVKLKAKRDANPEHRKEINNRYASKVRPKKIAYARTYRANNPTKVIMQRLKYYRSAKGKAYFIKHRQRHHDSPELIRNKYYLLWIANLPCSECGTYHRREVDHIIEQSKDGSDKLDNLRVLCFTHHRKAGYGRHSTWRAGD